MNRLLTSIGLFLLLLPSGDAADRPNIVVIMADDIESWCDRRRVEYLVFMGLRASQTI